MNQYEIAYFLSSNFNEEEANTVYLQKIKDMISELSGEIVKEQPLQKKKLAYPVKKEKQGYFGFMLFNLDPANIKLLDKKLKLEEYVLRYMVLVVDKKHMAHMKRKDEEIKEKFQKIMQQPDGETPSVSKKTAKTGEKEKLEAEIEKKLEQILG